MQIRTDMALNSWIPLLCILLAGCGADGGQGSVSAGADTTLVISSDPGLRLMAASLLPDLAERSGLELTEPVRVESRSREQLERYLAWKLDQELPPETARGIAGSYALLGLAPEGLDLRALLLSVYTEQVAGFYDPDSTALFVMDDQPQDALATVLIHELVHAVQDQAVDLDALTDRDRGNDRQTAAQAAIEGHATLVMMEYLLEQAQGSPVDLATMPDMADLMGPTLAAVDEQYPALAQAPRVLQRSLLFPYLEGAGFVQDLWRSRGHGTAPFGEFLPQSTEQVLDPTRLLSSPVDSPLDVELSTSPGPGATYANTLGMLELTIFLEEHLGPDGEALASGWAGDAFAYWEGTAGPGALAWVVVWDDVPSRDRFLAGVEGAVARLPVAGVAEALQVEGRPGTLIRIGDPPPVVASIRGSGEG